MVYRTPPECAHDASGHVIERYKTEHRFIDICTGCGARRFGFVREGVWNVTEWKKEKSHG